MFSCFYEIDSNFCYLTRSFLLLENIKLSRRPYKTEDSFPYFCFFILWLQYVYCIDFFFLIFSTFLKMIQVGKKKQIIQVEKKTLLVDK